MSHEEEMESEVKNKERVGRIREAEDATVGQGKGCRRDPPPRMSSAKKIIKF